MPGLGDFFHIRAGRAFVPVWDVWLQTALQDARTTLGSLWQESYLSAPIWRFTLGPGTAGPRGMIGVLMPSVDRVGRCFPLTLMAPFDGDPIAAHLAQAAVFARLEDIALDALDDTMTRDRLAAALDTVVLNTATSETPQDDVALPDAGETRRMKHPGLWSALVGDVVLFRAIDGLPRGAQALELFAPQLPQGPGPVPILTLPEALP